MYQFYLYEAEYKTRRYMLEAERERRAHQVVRSERSLLTILAEEWRRLAVRLNGHPRRAGDSHLAVAR